MEASTAETTTGLAREMQAASNRLKSTQMSLGVRAGCQLWANFFSDSQLSSYEFHDYKRNLIEQGRAFCNVTAAQCREKIADLAVDFLQDDCTVRRNCGRGATSGRCPPRKIPDTGRPRMRASRKLFKWNGEADAL